MKYSFNNEDVVEAELIEPEIVGEEIENTLKSLKEEARAAEIFQIDENAVNLLAQIRNGDITGKELTDQQRRLCVYTLKKQGGTYDEIAALLGVSRYLVSNDMKWIELQTADELKNLDTYKLGADLYTKYTACVEGALKEKKWKIASYAMRDMVEVLQEMGIVYRAPTQQNVAAIVGHANLPDGHRKYIDNLGDDKDKYRRVLTEMLKLAD